MWNINNIELKLYYLSENNAKQYVTPEHYDIYQSQIDIEDNEPLYIVYYPYDSNIPLDTPIYQEMYYKNKYISTSNGVKWLEESNGGTTIPPINQNIGQITNTSGDVTGSVNLNGLQEYLVSIVQTIKSGDDKIVATLESGERANQERFEFWQQQYYEFMSGDQNKIDGLVSGEIFNASGDFFGINYDDIDFDNWGFGEFFVGVINAILNTAVSTTDVSYNAGFLGTISSADFIIANNDVRSFISYVTNSILILTTIFFYYRFIKKVCTFDLNLLRDYDIDNMINIF